MLCSKHALITPSRRKWGVVQTQTVYVAESMFLPTRKKINTKTKAVSFSVHENTMIYFLISREGFYSILQVSHQYGLLTNGQPSNAPAHTQGFTNPHPTPGWAGHPSHFCLLHAALLSFEFLSSAAGYIPRGCISVPQNEESRNRYSGEMHAMICFKNIIFKGVLEF